MSRIFGRPVSQPAAIDFDVFLGFHHPEDRDDFRQLVARVIAERVSGAGGCFQDRLRVVRPNGEIRDVIVHGAPERDPTGAVAALYGIGLDVTGLMEAERRDRKSGEFLRTALENMDQGILMLGPDQRVRLRNHRALECPSSDDLRRFAVLRNGGSGPPWLRG